MVLAIEKKEQLLASAKTPWGDLEVCENGSIRSLYLKNRTAIQSQVDMAKKEKLLLEHSRAMMSFLLFRPQPKSVLLFGLGGGSIIHFLNHWFPNLNITAVDVSDKVISIAEEYFNISQTPQINIQLADAFVYLVDSKEKDINIILIDIHDGKSIPDFLYHHAFIEKCYHTLSSDGILVVNLLVDNDEDFLNIMRALRQHFTNVSLCITFKDQKNLLLFAFKALRELDMDRIRSAAILNQKKYSIEFESFIKNAIKIDPKNEE